MNTKSDPDAKNMACLLKAMDDSGMIKLRRDHADFRGNNPESDGATALDNIRDACDGKPALRYKLANNRIREVRPFGDLLLIQVAIWHGT